LISITILYLFIMYKLLPEGNNNNETSKSRGGGGGSSSSINIAEFLFAHATTQIISASVQTTISKYLTGAVLLL